MDLVTRRTPQRDLGDRLMNVTALLMRAQSEMQAIMPVVEVYEKRIRGTGNLPPVTHTRGR